MYSTNFNKIKFCGYDRYWKFTEPEKKIIPLLPWKPWPSESEVQKNYSLALIIEIMYLKQNFFKRIVVC